MADSKKLFEEFSRKVYAHEGVEEPVGTEKDDK
jgi:hypothetical protein